MEKQKQIENCMKKQCNFCSRKWKCDKEIEDKSDTRVGEVKCQMNKI